MPTLPKAVAYNLGGDVPVAITTQKYSGSITIPVGANLRPEAPIVKTGVAGNTSVSRQGNIVVELNNNVTSLASVQDSAGNVYMLSLFPKSPEIKQKNATIDSLSTATAMIAMQAGLTTSNPLLDAIILKIKVFLKQQSLPRLSNMA